MRPYPAAAWAAAGPYPGEVSIDSFGAKMEHRSVSDLYAGDVDPVTLAVDSPVRRVSPNGVLADPLWRCSRYGEARSYHDYPLVKNPNLPAYRRNLDGPSYELSAYTRAPLDFPLNQPGYLFDTLNSRSVYGGDPLYNRRDRRFGYLDDPLYNSRAAFVDDPLYRRSARVDDPLYARSAYLDDPLYRRSTYVDDPLDRRSALVDDPLFARGRSAYLDDPLYRRTNLDDPLYRRSALVDDPLYRRSRYLDDPLHRRAAYLDAPSYRRAALDDPVFGRGRSLMDPRIRSASPRARVPVV